MRNHPFWGSTPFPALLKIRFGNLKPYYFISLLFLIYCNCGIPTNNDDYSLLSGKIETNYRYVNGDFLNVIYREDYNDQDGFLTYKILLPSQIEVQSSFKIPVKYGNNKLNISNSHFDYQIAKSSEFDTCQRC